VLEALNSVIASTMTPDPLGIERRIKMFFLLRFLILPKPHYQVTQPPGQHFFVSMIMTSPISLNHSRGDSQPWTTLVLTWPRSQDPSR
jgi:hypothetical protein